MHRFLIENWLSWLLSIDNTYVSLLRDILIEQLMREIVELKDRIRELEEQNEANQELIGSLRQQLEEVWNVFNLMLTNPLSPL